MKTKIKFCKKANMLVKTFFEDNKQIQEWSQNKPKDEQNKNQNISH